MVETTTGSPSGSPLEISDTTSKYTNYLVPETTSEWHSVEADDLLSPHTPFSFGFDSEFGAKISTTESPIANEFTTIAPSFPAVVAQNDIEYEYYSEEEEVEDYNLNKDANSDEINEVTEQVRQRHQFQFHFDQAPRPAGASTEASIDYDYEGTPATTEPPPITTQRFRDFSAFSTIQSILQTTTVPTTTPTSTTTRPKVEMFDGVIVRQIEPNLRQKAVGTVDAKDPIVVNSQRPEIVLGTFKNMVDNEFGNPSQDSSEEYYYSDEYYSDEYYSDEYYSDEYYDEEPSQKLEKLVVSTPKPTPRPSIFSTTFRPEPITTFRPEFVSSTGRPVEVSTIRFTPDEVSTPGRTQAPQVFTGSFVSTTFPSTNLISQAPQQPQQSQKEAPKRQRRPRPSRPRQKPAEFGSRPSQQVVEAQKTKPRKPKANARPLTKSERLRVIQEKLKNLNKNGRWEKRNQRRKKLGNRVKSVPSDQPFPRAQNRSLKLENNSQQQNKKQSKPESIESKIVKSITSLFSSKLNKSESTSPKKPNTNQESKSASKRRKFGAKLLPSLLRL